MQSRCRYRCVCHSGDLSDHCQVRGPATRSSARYEFAVSSCAVQRRSAGLINKKAGMQHVVTRADLHILVKILNIQRQTQTKNHPWQETMRDEPMRKVKQSGV